MPARRSDLRRARPLRRFVQTAIGDVLAKEILAGTVVDGSTVSVGSLRTSDHSSSAPPERRTFRHAQTPPCWGLQPEGRVLTQHGGDLRNYARCYFALPGSAASRGIAMATATRGSSSTVTVYCR